MTAEEISEIRKCPVQHLFSFTDFAELRTHSFEFDKGFNTGYEHYHPHLRYLCRLPEMSILYTNKQVSKKTNRSFPSLVPSCEMRVTNPNNVSEIRSN